MPGFVICPHCGATVQPLRGPDGRNLCPVCQNRGRAPAPTAAPMYQATIPGAYNPGMAPGGLPGNRPNAPGAVASLVCAIIGCVTGLLGIVLGIVAVVLSSKAKRAISANPGRYGGEGLAKAGGIVGIVAIVLAVATIVLAAVVFVLVANLADGAPPQVEFDAQELADRFQVIQVEPEGVLWSAFEAEGTAGCALPSGQVVPGQFVTCTGDGTFVLRHTATDEVVYTGFV